MHRSLKWQKVGIEEKLVTMQAWLLTERTLNPPHQQRDTVKMTRWLTRLRAILRAIDAVLREVKPRIEEDLGYRLEDEELLLLAMFQPSTRNLFTEIDIHFRGRHERPLTSTDLRRMAGLAEEAKTLAWIGDGALKIGVLGEIWTPDIAEAGVLTERRKAYDSNANQARLCDRWRLYEHRIHLDRGAPGRDVEHVKGTLVEALFGILFLQGGLREVGKASRLLAPESFA